MRFLFPAIVAVIFLSFLVVAVWQYAPQARERAIIRRTAKEYLANQFYPKAQILDIRIVRNYATVIAYDLETLVLFLQKKKGKWEVVIHGNLLTRDTIRTKLKDVPEEILQKLLVPKSGSFQGDL